MRRIDYTIPPAYEGRKVLHFLRGAAGCSVTLVRSLKTFEDGILLNGIRTRTIDRLHAGDQLSISVHDSPAVLEPSGPAVTVLYEDDDLAIYDKPPDMACHPSRSLREGTLANVFARDTALTCRILGRLDRDTSGAVVIAKNAYAAAALTGQLHKTYLALTMHAPCPPSGVIDAPIGQIDRADPRRFILADGRPAVTHYETLAHSESFALVKCVLETGRTHQIRVHLASVGCPLLGDLLYGGEQSLIGRQALHCARVELIHPVSGVSLCVNAPLPQDMQKLMLTLPQTW